jgi:hypothetical protein
MRAIKMTPKELHDYTSDLIAQKDRFQTSLMETAAYSNGSFRYDDLLQMPVKQYNKLEEIIVKKLKQDRGIKEQSML